MRGAAPPGAVHGISRQLLARIGEQLQDRFAIGSMRSRHPMARYSAKAAAGTSYTAASQISLSFVLSRWRAST